MRGASSGFGGTRTVSGQALQGEREHRQKLSTAATGQGGVQGVLTACACESRDFWVTVMDLGVKHHRLRGPGASGVL